MKDLIGKKVILTSTSWFLAPDGLQYKGAFGTLKAIHTSQETLGFTPSRSHTNWYIEIGNLHIAGCQVLQMVKSDICNLSSCVDSTTERVRQLDKFECSSSPDLEAEKFSRPSYIYQADNDAESTR